MAFFSFVNWFLLSFLFPASSSAEENDPCSSTSVSKKQKISTTGSKVEGADCTDHSVFDRLNNLPDEVAQQIMSSVSFKELARLGALSKQSREWFLSQPFLDFDLSTFPRNTDKRLSWLNSFDKLMVDRGDNKIVRFHIHWPYLKREADLEYFRMVSWIQDAVRCNVEELHIACGMEWDMLTLPSNIFNSSLRTLSLHLHMMIFRGPFSSPDSCNLRCLKLRYVQIVDERFCDWISHCCKFLEEFELYTVKGIQSFTIRSSSMKSFKLVSSVRYYQLNHLSISGEKLQVIHICWPNRFPCLRNCLHISAPNLRNFRWSGRLANIQNLGNFPHLEQVEISMTNMIAFGVLSGMCWVKVLILDSRTMKALFETCSSPPPLDHMREFVLHLEKFSDNLVRKLASLLRVMPNLKTLCIKCEWGLRHRVFYPRDEASAIDMEYWKRQNLAFVRQLNEVAIELCCGSNGFELVMYILEHARNLQKMVIVYPAEEQSNAVSKLNNIRVISSAAHIFQEKRYGSWRPESRNWFRGW